MVNGAYPNTSNLLPNDSILVVSTNLNDFYNVIDRVSILTSDKEKNIVTLETQGDVLILKSSSIAFVTIPLILFLSNPFA